MVTKSLPGIVLIVIPCLFINEASTQTLEKCCIDDNVTSACEREANDFANRFLAITASPLFDAEPEPVRKDLQDQLSAMKQQNSEVHKQFISAIKSYSKWLKPNPGPRAGCVYSFIDPEHENDKNWIVETTSLYRKFKAYSPEFCRGWRYHIELGGGVKDLGATSESFMGSIGVLASFTFAPTDENANIDPNYDKPHCNGRFRLGAGITETYVDRSGLTSGLLRMEYKLLDIKTDFFSLGNVKAITQGSIGINRDFHTIGLGLGAETEIISVNLIYGIGLEEVNSTLQLSFVYNSKLCKK